MTVNPAESEIFGALYGEAEMRALFSDRAQVQSWLDVEAALARAQAKLGLIPAAAAEAISRAAKADAASFAELGAATRLVGYPIVGLTKILARDAGAEAGRWVHWGATTQDILDSGLVLQIRDGLALVERELRAIIRALCARAKTHRMTVMAGRTHLQHALPITFGYKCAVWAAPLVTHLERLRELRPRVLVVQFAGAAGTLASLGERGRAVTVALAEELGLGVPDAPWHVNRDALVETACLLGLICGSLAKIATDVILLMQTEIGEVCEPHQSGRGSSSTMPQKRNPIASEYVIACARGVHALAPLMMNAMAQDHERGTGPWQSEPLALPQIFVLTAGALAQARAIAEGMTVDAARMRKNLDVTGGQIVAEAVMMALAEAIGRGAAHDVVHHACERALAEGRPLADTLLAEPQVAAHFDATRIRALTDPVNYLGEATAVVDRVVARAEAPE